MSQRFNQALGLPALPIVDLRKGLIGNLKRVRPEKDIEIQRVKF
jgi:hypothetical protein